ncbi:nucleotidyltransferase domain-containing protein [Paludibaculum fermentans]|uniref:Nucleotidyltransferase n=1 Tax=Paludibaculum fermentans TaxID=1473598 RepID=A0A7S7NS29_PALFE|nr:nucleotidyltransferase [Paludibaculum fermentans]
MSVYSQGSVRLGTSTAPIARAGFDADLVCQLPGYAWRSQPRNLFETVGEHLRALPGFRGDIQRKRRCWTLVFSPQFHVDVTPAIANENSQKEDVLVFDGPSQDWRISNPSGYAYWFNKRQRARAHCSAMPLVAVVQLLKRRRDLLLNGPDAPNSIVITTLAASVYSGEPTIVEALSNVLRGMLAALEGFDKHSAVTNPVTPSEVYSENWIGNSSAIKLFCRFLKDLQSRLAFAESARCEGQAAQHLHELFGVERGSIN